MTNLNHNGVITVQAQKNRGSGLKHVSAPRELELTLNCSGSKDFENCIQNTGQLRPCGLKVSLVTIQRDPNQSLLNKHPNSCQLQL